MVLEAMLIAQIKHTRLDLVSQEVSTPVLWAAALFMVAVWIGAHWLAPRLRPGLLRLAGAAVRIIIGAITLWTLWQAVSRFLLLETDWSLWTNAFLGALAVEIVAFLYQLERRIVSPRLGRALLALRLAAVGAVLLILVQPVFARDVKRRIERKVVVLVDDSASMHISDKQMSVEERVALAQFYGIDALKNRPSLAKDFDNLRAARGEMEKLSAGMDIQEGFGADMENAIVERSRGPMEKLTNSAVETAGTLRNALRQTQNLPDEARRLIDEMDRQLNDTFPNRMRDANRRISEGRVRDARSNLQQAMLVLDRILSRAPYLVESADNQFYQTVSPEVRQKIDEVAGKRRSELARETMLRPRDGKSLLDMVQEKYGVQLVRFGKKSTEVPDWEFPAEGEDEEFRMRTDITSALGRIAETFEPENLAGVLVLSDSRHNTDMPVDDFARKLGNQGSPICPVVIGSQKGSKDVAIVTVGAPQSIYQGDRIRTRVELKADGMRGQAVKIRLLQDGSQVAEQSVSIPDNSYRTTVRLSYAPKDPGIFSYAVKIDPVEGELFKNNNEWGFQTAVSDDRTNVLLIDDRPRWEFRYLRNLFDSRDKSVHLQYYLLHPDNLPGEGRPTNAAASASRKFGESEAARLPENAEEWKKFDVIILGDLPPAALGEQAWETIKQCVEDRGAMLVLIAGPLAMPHAYSNEVFRDMCPVLFQQTGKSMAQPPEEGYRLERTAEGINHLIMQQSSSSEQNNAIWNAMPVLRWRHGIDGVKESAEVLAYARAVNLDASGNEIANPQAIATLDPAALEKQKQLERKNALVVVSQFGTGKVAMLTFDHTWRFRYGIGDTYHHRFWGQLLRWGAGETLRAGNDLVRLGTDKLTYETGEKIVLLAKLQEQDYRPVQDADIYVTLFREGEKVLKRKLEFRKDSHGMYEAVVEGVSEPGDYSVELAGDDVARLLRTTSGGSQIATKFTISSAANPVEFGDLSVDRELAAKLAGQSGGIVTSPATAAKALEYFGPASKEKVEPKETKLWDNWLILAAAVGLLTCEWIVRRRGGLV